MGRWTVCICIKRYFTVVSVMHSWNGKRVARSHVIASNVYKCLHEAAPTYLTEMVSFVSASVSRRHLRSATHGDLAVPRSRTTRYSQRSFSVSGVTLWNSLPSSVRDPSLTLTQFFASWRPCCSAQLMKYYHRVSVTVQAVRIAARTRIYLLTYLLCLFKAEVGCSFLL